MRVRCPECGSSNKVTLKHKVYCANCGEFLKQPVQETSTPQPTHHQPKRQPTGHVLDLSSPPKSPAGQTAQALTAAAHKPAQSIHGVRKQPPAKTMKPQVPDPSPVVANNQAPAKSSTKGEVTPVAKVQRKHEQRQQRAAQIARSHHVRKFASDVNRPVPGVTEDAEPAPDPVTLSPHQTYLVNAKVAQADAAAAIAMQHSRFVETPTPTDAAVAQPKRQRFNPFARLAAVFKARPRFAMATAVTACVVLLAGYVTYLNYPNLALRVAAGRAGIDAQMPAYTPSGYSFDGPIDSASGQITVRFTSNSDAGFITIGQRKTSWDSASLLENYVLRKSKNYITFQENGLTIYMFNGNNAAWVNRGVFYTIEGNNYLNSEQVLKMATSL